MCKTTGLSLLLVRFSRVVIGLTESRDPIYAQQTLAPPDGKKSLAMAHMSTFYKKRTYYNILRKNEK